MLYMVYRGIQTADSSYLTSAGITITLILAFYIALHYVIANYFASVNKWLGALLAIAPVALVYLFVEPAGDFSAVTYVGASLILMAVRGDGGCEVMAFPALVVGRFTHLVCIAFSPIDWLEEKIALKFQGAGCYGIQPDVDAIANQRFLHDLCRVLVFAAENVGVLFDQRNLRTEPSEGLSHLAPDGTGANHGQPPGKFGQRKNGFVR